MALYKNYKNNNYGHNTQHNQNDRSDRNHESQDRRNYDNDNIFDPIIKYLKNPENGNEYSLFSTDGIIYEIFYDMNGGSQIRKFYNSVVEITDQYNKMEVAKGKLARILPIIYYAKKRNLVDDLFLNFVKLSLKTLNDINNEDDFKKSLRAFREVFQAVIAYSKEKNR